MNPGRVLAGGIVFMMMAMMARGQNCQSRLLCPSNVVAECQSPQGADVPFIVSGTNTCFPSRVVCAPPSGSFFPVGTNRVCCELQVAEGGTSLTATQCCFEVIVRCGTKGCSDDTTPPVVLCPRGGRLIRCAKKEGEILKFKVPAYDDCDTNLAVFCTPPSGSL